VRSYSAIDQKKIGITMRKQSSFLCLLLALLGFAFATRDGVATDYVWARSPYGAMPMGQYAGYMSNGYGGYYVPRNAPGNNFEGSQFRNAGGLIVPSQGGVYNAPRQMPGRWVPTQQAYAQPSNSQQSGIQQTSSTAPQNFDGGEVVLFSAANTPGDVQYTLNGVSYVMKPDQVQRFTNDRRWIIEIPSSAGQAQQRFTLVTGRYKFKPAANGVELVQTADQPGSDGRPNGSSPAPAPK
jgi:hypothetical protein